MATRMRLRMTMLGIFATFAAVCGSAFAQEIPIVTGEHWTKSTEDVKKAYLIGISNMVQIAAYTRRTETSIMRLVGASRWRTQLPFMIEAVTAGIIGAGLAILGLIGAKFLFVDKALGPVIRSGILPDIDGATLVWVSPILIAIGAGLAAVSAYVTLRLYVRL